MAVTEEPVNKPGTKAVRPKDAATLIIYRRRGNIVEVLMGKRHRKHKFLPERYVFPVGGSTLRTVACAARHRSERMSRNS